MNPILRGVPFGRRSPLSGGPFSTPNHSNAYSVPWRLIGEPVRVMVGGGAVRVLHAGREVAVHAELKGRHGRATDERHLAGLVGSRDRPVGRIAAGEVSSRDATSALLRPLAEYEALIGGGF